MKTNPFLLIFLFLGINVAAQKSGKLTINSTFWDINTGVDLVSTVSGFENGNEFKIKDTDSNQKLDFELKTTCDSLAFWSKGYDKIVFPISFVGNFQKNQKAEFGVTTLGQLSQDKNKERDYLIFCNSNSQKQNLIFELYHVSENGELRYHTSLDLRKFPFSSHSVQLHSLKKQLAQIKIPEGIVLKEKLIYPKKGVSPTPSILKVKEVFFEQSEYKLSAESKNALDEVFDYLKANPNSTINLMGFTDNVGDAKKNTTLAEFRAKVVANYLITKGIAKERIKTNWQDASIKTIEIDSKKLNEYRKVTISE
jgi:outer membrane protein OmpA-like peptidoglycan-associated protein